MHTKNPMLAALAVALFTGPVTVQAQYNYELIDHPGAAFTQVFGNNEQGDVAGTGVTNPTNLPFIFDSKKGTYTDIVLKTATAQQQQTVRMKRSRRLN